VGVGKEVGRGENKFQIQLKFKHGVLKRQTIATGTQAVVKKVTHPWVVPGTRPEGIVKFEEQMVSFFVDAADLLGVPKSVAAIYGIVFASPEPLSFSKISARLNFSNGSDGDAGFEPREALVWDVG